MTITKADVVTKEAFRVSALPAANKVTDADINELVRVTDDLVDSANALGSGITFITALADFPDPVAGVITLAADTTYWIVGDVDLAGNRLVASANTVILGGSSENSILRSTGLTSGALLSSAFSLPIRHVAFHDALQAVSLSGDGVTTAIDWYGVNFVDCETVGLIENYTNVILVSLAILNSGDLLFDGTIGTIGIDGSLISVAAGFSGIKISGSAVVTRRLRVNYSSIVAGDPSATGIEIQLGATIPDEGFILDTINFSGGGTYVTGATFSDNVSRWTGCKGITNSAVIGNMFMQNNATPTAVASAGALYAVTGTTQVAALNQRFTHDAANNALEYAGAEGRLCRIQASATILAPNNNVIGVYLAQDPDGSPLVPADDAINESEVYITTNGSRPDSVFLQAFAFIEPGDKIYVAVENSAATGDITVQFLQLIVEQSSI